MPGTRSDYGDEIGMGDNLHLGDRDGVRTPAMVADRNGGFSRADPAALILPMIMTRSTATRGQCRSAPR
jgi:maltose alpha-D-glucosyltransferase/alpha-amylase